MSMRKLAVWSTHVRHTGEEQEVEDRRGEVPAERSGNPTAQKQQVPAQGRPRHLKTTNSPTHTLRPQPTKLPSPYVTRLACLANAECALQHRHFPATQTSWSRTRSSALGKPSNSKRNNSLEAEPPQSFSYALSIQLNRKRLASCAVSPPPTHPRSTSTF